MPVTVADQLKELREHCGIGLREAAAAAGLATSTYAHYENPDRFKRTFLPLELVNALAPAWSRHGQPLAPLYALAGIDMESTSTPGGMRDVEIARYEPATPEDRRLQALQMFATGRNCCAWIIRGRALILAGLLPGDLVLVDHDRLTPAAGAVVCAQLYDWDAGAARTVIRIYEPPYLVSASTDRSYAKPELVDGNNVQIKGTVVASLRLFQS